ncbi:MAG: hypothetical protein ABIF10_08525 [Candidatus Woesearchaeota archaeon]
MAYSGSNIYGVKTGLYKPSSAYQQSQQAEPPMYMKKPQYDGLAGKLHGYITNGLNQHEPYCMLCGKPTYKIPDLGGPMSMYSHSAGLLGRAGIYGMASGYDKGGISPGGKAGSPGATSGASAGASAGSGSGGK